MLKRSFDYLVVGGLLTGIVRVCQAEASALPAELPFKRESAQEALIFSPWIIGALCVLRLFVRSKGLHTSAVVSWRTPWRSWFTQKIDARLRIVASCQLPQGASLHSVEWEGERLLLSCSSQGVRLLAREGSDAQSAAKHLSDVALDIDAVTNRHPAEKNQADGR